MSPAIVKLLPAFAALLLQAWEFGILRIRRHHLHGLRRLPPLLPALICSAGTLVLLGVIVAGLFVSSVMTW